MNDLSSLLADATEQAKPTKPPLPANGLERIQAQWEDLTDDPFDFGSIQRLLNIAKSAGGGARTVGIVFDEVPVLELPPSGGWRWMCPPAAHIAPHCEALPVVGPPLLAIDMQRQPGGCASPLLLCAVFKGWWLCPAPPSPCFFCTRV